MAEKLCDQLIGAWKLMFDVEKPVADEGRQRSGEAT